MALTILIALITWLALVIQIALKIRKANGRNKIISQVVSKTEMSSTNQIILDEFVVTSGSEESRLCW